MIEELLERTRSPQDILRAATRVAVLGARLWYDPSTRVEACREADILLERFPDVLVHPFHASFLNNLGSSLIVTGNYDDDEMKDFKRRIDAALAAGNLSHAVREEIYIASTFTLLANPTTAGELERQLAALKELEGYSERVRAHAVLIRADRLMNVGRFDSYVTDVAWTLEYYRGLGLDAFMKGALAFLTFARGAYAADLEGFEREAEECLAGLHDEEATFWRQYMGINLVSYALLRGEPERARAAAGRYPEGLEGLSPLLLGVLGLAGGELEASERPATPEPQPDAALRSLIRFWLAPTDDALLDALEQNRSTLSRRPLRVYDLLYTHAAMTLLERLDEKSKMVQQLLAGLGTQMHDGLVAGLEWLAEPGRELHTFMPSLVALGARYLSPKEIAEWHNVIESLQLKREQRAAEARGDDTRIQITMLGTISARLLDADTQRFQGARIRQLLGVMVANQMLARPLSVAEFRQLVAGGEEIEGEHARNILKKTVHRLRETLGHSVVLTDGETPRLNPALVRVDLLEAQEHLRAARESLRRLLPMKAKSLLLAAFKISGNDVPFPTLYDDFFEAAREEYETSLRSASVDIATELLRQGALSDAEDVMVRGCDAMPGDEDLTELLHDILKLQGKHIEAERVRMKSMADA